MDQIRDKNFLIQSLVKDCGTTNDQLIKERELLSELELDLIEIRGERNRYSFTIEEDFVTLDEVIDEQQNRQRLAGLN